MEDTEEAPITFDFAADEINKQVNAVELAL